MNEWDATCRTHDISIASAETEDDVRKANQVFYDSNYGKSLLRSTAAILVRDWYPFSMPPKTKNKKKSNLRSGDANTIAKAIKEAVAAETKTKNKKPTIVGPKMTTSIAPVSIGTTVTSKGANYRYSDRNTLTLSGRDFLTSLPETNQTNWHLSTVVPINPLYFGSTPIGRAAAVYKKFRFKRLAFQYVTRQPTSSAGEILMSLNTSVSDEALSSTGSDFLSKAMSYPCALMGPLWVNHTLKCPIKSTWSNVDCLSSVDYDDNIPFELYVYVQSAITDVVGYLFIDYEIEFAEVDYNERTTAIPLANGYGVVTGLVDSPAPVAGAPMVTSAGTLPGGSILGNGAVFKLVINSTASTYGTPQVAGTALQVVNRTVATFMPVVDGLTLYGSYSSGGVIAWYPSVELAYVSSDTQYVAYRTTGTQTTWIGNFYVLSWGAVFRT